ncbi:MAG TPA: 30S ribosomal protein S9 [bacterium]|nr:30S ribosomal protein S9 [bacterium]
MSEAIKKFYGTGRRKEAVARVWVMPGSGRFIVDGKDVKERFPRATHLKEILGPLKDTALEGQLDVRAVTCGGGVSGQAGAIRLGVARALLEMNEELRKRLRQYGHLTRDPRMKERKKYGQPGARKRFQFSKR